jgi:hypothetical protein
LKLAAKNNVREAKRHFEESFQEWQALLDRCPQPA